MARSTIADILKWHGIELAPERSRKTTWKEFLSRHWELMVAMSRAPPRTPQVLSTRRMNILTLPKRSFGMGQYAPKAVELSSSDMESVRHTPAPHGTSSVRSAPSHPR